MKRIAYLITALIITQTCQAQSAYDFTFTDTKGVTHSLYSDYLDQGKTVLVDFFFVDCPPCNAFAPTLQDLYEDWGEGQGDVEFFTLSSKEWDSNIDVAGYELQHGATNPGAGDDGGAFDVFALYNNSEFGFIFGSPFFMVIAADGSVQWDISGIGNQGKYDALNDALITATTIPDTTTMEEEQDTMTVTIDTFNISINVSDPKGNDVDDIIYTLVSGENGTNGLPLQLNDGSFSFTSFEEDFPGITDPHIKIEKDGDWLNGVSTVDMLLIARHILWIQRFDQDYQFLAGDITQDQKITTADIVEIRKMLLEITDEFSSGISWMFNPSVIPISLEDGNLEQEFSIQAIKLGDVNRH